MKKLEKEQLPKVVALGVTVTGLLAYACYSWLGNGSGSAKAAADPATAGPAPTPPVKMAQTPPVQNLGIPLPPLDNPDPFRPAVLTGTGTPPPAPAAPPPKPAAAAPGKPSGGDKPPAPVKTAALPDVLNGPAMDGLPAVSVPPVPALKPQPEGGAQPAPAAAKARPAAPAPPTAPAVVVTGILEGDDNVAILKWTDAQRQVVRVGDRLDGGYTVKAIRPDGVLLTLGSHQWLMRLGSSK
jgi:hypothetical protein